VDPAGRGRNLIHGWAAKYIPDGNATCQSPTYVPKKDRQVPTPTSGDNSNSACDGRISSRERAIGASNGLQLIWMRQQQPLQHFVHKGDRFVHQLFHG
jgi:hypothetical protein